MESNTVPLIVCTAVGLVVLINGGLILSRLRNRGSHPYRGVLNMFKVARNPWQHEDHNLEELRTRVADLKKEPEEGHESE